MDELFGQDARNEPDYLHFELRYKRLENGLFSLPCVTEDEPRSVSISFETLGLLLDGIDVMGAKRTKG